MFSHEASKTFPVPAGLKEQVLWVALGAASRCLLAGTARGRWLGLQCSQV